jgi:hypothetical protein
MQLLRTAAGGFINAARIVRLADERGGEAGGWVAILDEGEVALAPYYSAPGRVERDLPDLAPTATTRRPALAPMPADCSAGICCYEL